MGYTTGFSISNCNTNLARKADLVLLDAALAAIKENKDGAELRIAAVWDRKGYPAYGDLAFDEDCPSQQYYRNGSEDILVSVAVLVGRDGDTGPAVKALVEQTLAHEQALRVAQRTQAQKDTRRAIDALRAQADRLEQQLQPEETK